MKIERPINNFNYRLTIAVAKIIYRFVQSIIFIIATKIQI